MFNCPNAAWCLETKTVLETVDFQVYGFNDSAIASLLRRTLFFVSQKKTAWRAFPIVSISFHCFIRHRASSIRRVRERFCLEIATIAASIRSAFSELSTTDFKSTNVSQLSLDFRVGAVNRNVSPNTERENRHIFRAWIKSEHKELKNWLLTQNLNANWLSQMTIRRKLTIDRHTTLNANWPSQITIRR